MLLTLSLSILDYINTKRLKTFRNKVPTYTLREPWFPSYSLIHPELVRQDIHIRDNRLKDNFLSNYPIPHRRAHF